RCVGSIPRVRKFRTANGQDACAASSDRFRSFTGAVANDPDRQSCVLVLAEFDSGGDHLECGSRKQTARFFYMQKDKNVFHDLTFTLRSATRRFRLRLLQRTCSFRSAFRDAPSEALRIDT